LRSPLIVRVDPNLAYVEEETVVGFILASIEKKLLHCAAQIKVRSIRFTVSPTTLFLSGNNHRLQGALRASR
jgi:hypothetical protein